MNLHDAPWQREVGPGWDVVLVPEQVAHRAVVALGALSTNPVGAVFAIHGVWGFFLPPESDIPPWPARVQYLRSGSQVTLPPSCWTRDQSGSGSGWVRSRSDGHLLTPPLMLHPIVAALCCPRGGRRPIRALGCSREDITVKPPPPAVGPGRDEARADADALRSLAVALDVHEAEVPGTADAFRTFFDSP
ncbi:hypothetical protein ABZ370_31250 [Streptomyces sp. NPDC005962]|uniref:hypothetical protein n=1 Tax=Streptomyces sp. NPDC005962 TaxID=3154466 RepID=UPI0033C69122